jgi:Tfp pilus assembly PilM family ATPase
VSARIVIEWTRSSVRVAVAEDRGTHRRLRTVQSRAIDGADTGEVLRALLKSVHARAAQAIGVISREQVITRIVKFPTTDAGELAQMTELYAKAQLPYPREQSVMDSVILHQQQGFSTMAIIACRRDVIDRALAVLRHAALPIDLLTVSSWGVLGWYRQARPRDGHEPALVVNVDDARTDLVLIAGDSILSSRSISQGVQDWQGVSETTELLALEVERSGSFIRKELPGTDVRSLILTGLGPLAQWREGLAQRVGLPVVAIDARQPFKQWKSTPESPVSPVVVGGLALSETQTLLNLNPPEIRLALRDREQTRELVTASGLMLGVVALGAGLLGVEVARPQRYAQRLDRALSDVSPTAKQLQEQSRFSRLVSTTLDSRRQLAATLARLFQQTPEAITLEALTFERARRELILRGNAPSTQAVLDYLKQLESLEGIARAELKYSTRRVTAAGERTDFELILRPQSASS